MATLNAANYEHCIPLALHGDEGRARAKQPILVMSVQPLLPLNDGKTNMQGYPVLFHSMFYL